MDFDVRGLPKDLIKDIKKDFRVINPYFDSRDKDCEESKYLPIFKLENNIMEIPRGSSGYLVEWFKEYNIEYVIKDERLELDEIDFPDLKFTPYKHQRKIIKKGHMLTQGTIESPCFVSGTMIRTVDGETPLELIKKGDLIYAYDVLRDEVVLTEVVNHFKKELNEIPVS